MPVLNASTLKPSLYFSIQGKAVSNKLPELFSLYRKILLEPQQDFTVKQQRLYQMLLEEKARLEYMLQAAGHSTVMTRLKARYRPEHFMVEQFSGISQLDFLKDLQKRLAEDPEKVLEDFDTLRSLIFSSRNALLDITADKSLIDRTIREGEELFAVLPEKADAIEGIRISELKSMSDSPKAEAFVTQGQVNYVGKAANLRDLDVQFNGSSQVISRWLRMGPLWENIRVAGGAYGAFCSLDKTGGTWCYASYRDPNVLETLQNYDNMGKILCNLKLDKSQLDQAIIGAVGDLDAYLLPDAKGSKALGWFLTGETSEQRQKKREEMLSATQEDFKNFGDALDAIATNGAISVVGGNKAETVARQEGWAARELQ